MMFLRAVYWRKLLIASIAKCRIFFLIRFDNIRLENHNFFYVILRCVTFRALRKTLALASFLEHPVLDPI